jgi:hypothetical protein
MAACHSDGKSQATPHLAYRSKSQPFWMISTEYPSGSSAKAISSMMQKQKKKTVYIIPQYVESYRQDMYRDKKCISQLVNNSHRHVIIISSHMTLV